jgi:hypothetical protein
LFACLGRAEPAQEFFVMQQPERCRTFREIDALLASGAQLADHEVMGLPAPSVYCSTRIGTILAVQPPGAYFGNPGVVPWA